MTLRSFGLARTQADYITTPRSTPHTGDKNMDWLTFSADLFKTLASLAWPAVIGGSVFFFREELRTLLAAVKSGKWGSAEVQFERGVAKAEEATANQPGSSLPTDPPTIQPDDAGIFRHAVEEPRLVVLEAWQSVEQEAVLAAIAMGAIKIDSKLPKARAISALHHHPGVNTKTKVLLVQLQKLRNSAVHDADFRPDPSSVVSYLDLSDQLMRELRVIQRHPPRPEGSEGFY